MKTTEAMEEHVKQLLMDAEFVRDYMFIGMRRATDSDAITRPGVFAGTEQFLYVRGTFDKGAWHVKLTHRLLESACLTEDEAWACAFANTCADGETVIEPLPVMLQNLGVFPPLSQGEDDLALYVLTNPNRYLGSGQITDMAAIRKYFNVYAPGCKYIVAIPSSIHECILIPMKEKTSLTPIHKMIREVNASVVDSKEQLGDKAYLIKL